MPFDVDQLTAFCRDVIEHFAAEHLDETFHAFAIDASMLCLNSEEIAKETLEGIRRHD